MGVFTLTRSSRVTFAPRKASLPLVLISLAVAGPIAAQTPAPQPPTPCEQDPNFRQLDFWVGEWSVRPAAAPANAPASALPQSRVEKILNGCVIFENWLPPGGAGGKSFNIYNRIKKQWEQTWVDGTGSVVHLTGELKDGNMVYRSEGPGPNGIVRQTRMTFFNLGPDKVRQLWESSTDSGKTWTVSFDGMYTRKQ
jgi:hypothetical protein